jgi:hypothetical protein
VSDASAADASAKDATAPSDAGIPTVVYVSSKTGRDSNSGLVQGAPKMSLAAAIAVAVALDAGVEVHACAGTYLESSLQVAGAISLRGAYDCSTWARTATFGYPTFDHTNDTIVENANPALQSATLKIEGSVSATTVIDGLTIVGAALLDGVTSGVQIQDEASPILRDDVIGGGGGHTTIGDGSYGIYIVNGAAPEVTHDAINGGTGMPGSAGVLIKSTGAPHVHNNSISGGLGPTSAVGIYLQSAAASPNGLDGNSVVACDSPGVAGDTSGIQVLGTDASVDIEGSQISGCSGVGDAGGQSIGIRVNSPGATLTVGTSRVLGGARSGASSYVAAVQITAASTLTVRNSMLHAGELANAGTSSANGLSIGTVGGASIDDDTIYAGPNGGTTVVLQTGATNVKITNAILMQGGPGQTHAVVFAQTCTGVIASLDNDLFANAGAALYDCNGTDGGAASSAPTLDALTALLPNAVAADLVYAQQSACDEDAGCVVTQACPGDPDACFGALFGASWSADDGVSSLLSSPAPDGGTIVGGWTLPAGTPCAIAQGGTPVSGIATDLYGTPRSATAPTIGAAELTGACTQ